jgi:hypothetical protein
MNTLNQSVKNLVTLLSIAAFPMGASAEPDDQPALHVFLFIGGINMEGKGHVEQQDIDASKDALMWDSRAKSWIQARPPFSRMSPHSYIRKQNAHRWLGPGPSFVREYAKANPGVRVGIINASRNVMDVRDWQGRYLRTAMGITKQALASQPEGAGKPVLKGVLWHGGEEATQEGHLDRYPKMLAEMIENLRKELPGGESLPVVFGQLDSETDYSKRYFVPFNEMIVKQIDVIPVTACVTTEGLKGHGMFFYNQGYRGLGERYAKEMNRLLKEARVGEVDRGDHHGQEDRSPLNQPSEQDAGGKGG